MNFTKIITAALAAVAVVLSAVLNVRAQKQKKRNDQNEALRRQFIECAAALLAANMALSCANARSIERGSPADELAPALTNLEQAAEQYNSLLRELGLESLL